jgi:hypothetical protein
MNNGTSFIYPIEYSYLESYICGYGINNELTYRIHYENREEFDSWIIDDKWTLDC